MDLHESRFEKIAERLDGLESHLKQVTSGIGSLKEDVSGLKSSASTVKWVAGIGLAGVIAVAGFAGKSVIKELARETVREELQYRSQYTQHGMLSPQNAIPDQAFVFAWKLQRAFAPEEVVAISAEPLGALPGVGIMPKLDADGKGCRMTLYGSDEILDALPDTIPAKVVISLK